VVLQAIALLGAYFKDVVGGLKMLRPIETMGLTASDKRFRIFGTRFTLATGHYRGIVKSAKWARTSTAVYEIVRNFTLVFGLVLNPKT
jgi:hypothetical protein